MAEIIDAHHHLWNYNPEEYGWIGPDMGVLKRDFQHDDLAVAMREAGVHGSVVVQARQSVAETRWLLECAETSPFIRGVVGWLPIGGGSLGASLAEFRGCRKLKGLRHVIHDEPDDDFILRDDFNAGIASMRCTGLVYDILIHERHLARAAEFVSRHPEQVFVLDHLAKPKVRDRVLEPWSGNLRRLAASENVYCKLSGLVTEADWDGWTPKDLNPYLDVALAAFGPERLMAGSDWPVCLAACGYKRWWDVIRDWVSRLSPHQQESIFGENAARVYRLDEVSSR